MTETTETVIEYLSTYSDTLYFDDSYWVDVELPRLQALAGSLLFDPLRPVLVRGDHANGSFTVSDGVESSSYRWRTLTLPADEVADMVVLGREPAAEPEAESAAEPEAESAAEPEAESATEPEAGSATETGAGDHAELVAELRESVTEFKTASEGDSGDAEFEAAWALAHAATAMIDHLTAATSQ